ncbi:PAS-domain containing protein [Thalassovita taeanensis]|uniref:histidine kinase n=1 Tax=Thalassovita taeanensis TaxID=657014 RepID=A0A1H9IMB0_9RHOB|nr:PAS-domain containing protein [Thalassovita taeanensis]SEQ75659.1 hypothetical protein SAMN04488092_11291 [Thalassovita taeanensis]
MPISHQDTTAMTMAGLNLIQQALSIYDSDLKLVVCNRPFREIFDLPDHLIIPGTDFADCIRYLVERGEYGPVTDIEAAVARRVAQARTFAPHYMERTRANGRIISVEGSPLPQGGWVTVYTDITRTKRQEELLRARSEELTDKVLSYAEELAATNRQLEATITALEEAKRQLTDTEARTRLTTEMMPAHIAHVGLDRHYTFSNLRLSSVMPGRPSHILGLHIRDALGQDAYSAIRPHLDQAFEGTPSVFEFSHQQSSRRIRTAFTPDRDATGTMGGVYILSMDVTEETQARTALQQTRRREMAAQLTSGMAHDFSNLLTIILGSQSRLQKMDLPQGAADMINATLSAAHRGGSLLNRIADITGARGWHPAPADMALFLDDLEILAAPALDDGIALQINNLLQEESLLFDAGMLQDSLLNLILNARHACDGTGRITLTVKAVQNLWAEFTVTDTGPGFSEPALHHALEPFFTTKGGEGSGLGLSMVYDMTTLAGGRMHLANTETGGQVSLLLPLRPAPARAAPGLVLLVEDSPDLREGVREMLTGLGHSVIEAASTEEALVLLQEVPGIAQILSDISLLGDDTGLNLLDCMPIGHPPILLMTSLPPNHPLHQTARARVPVLRKPFTASQLAAFLHQEGPAP